MISKIQIKRNDMQMIRIIYNKIKVKEKINNRIDIITNMKNKPIKINE